ncbi:MAG: sensor histidine kinase [Pseudohaliea sp.]
MEFAVREPGSQGDAPLPEHHEDGDLDACVDRAFELLNRDTAAAHGLASRVLETAEPDSIVAGRARHALGMAECLLGQVNRGHEQLRMAAETLETAGPSLPACRALRDHGMVLAYLVGDLNTGLEILERSLAAAVTLDDRKEEGATLSRLGAVLGHAGRHDDAREVLQRAVAMLSDHPGSEAYAGALSNLGHNCLLAGDYARALVLFREERELHDVQDARLRVANCNTNLAFALAGVGEFEEARAALDDTRSLLDPATDGNQWVDFLLTTGRVALLGGAPHEAVDALEKGLGEARSLGLHRIEIELLAALAEAQEATGELSDALQSERTLRKVEREWLDEQAAAQLRMLESRLALERERGEREVLEQARAELEERVAVRTAELQLQMRERDAAISERQAAEKALRQLNEELEDRVEQRTRELVAARDEAQRASLAKSEFLSRMSHELRTPLNAILGFGQLLQWEVRNSQQADSVKEILRAGKHLLELINEVLDLARIEAGSLTVTREAVPLAPLLEDCLTLIGPLAEARGIRIVDGWRDAARLVRADRVRLKQVLLNLLSNAVKYNREGGSLSILCLAEADGIQVRVSDTGEGLTPEQQARLFSAFERLDADKTTIEGTGIGLALSRHLVELMQGEIGVESRPGEGSTFWVRLPAIDSPPGQG